MVKKKKVSKKETSSKSIPPEPLRHNQQMDGLWNDQPQPYSPSPQQPTEVAPPERNVYVDHISDDPNEQREIAIQEIGDAAGSLIKAIFRFVRIKYSSNPKSRKGRRGGSGPDEESRYYF
jgi:hypothetical protein